MQSGLHLGGKPFGSKGQFHRGSAIHSFNNAVAGSTGIVVVCAVAFPGVKMYMTVDRIENDIERMEEQLKKMAEKLGIEH